VACVATEKLRLQPACDFLGSECNRIDGDQAA